MSGSRAGRLGGGAEAAANRGGTVARNELAGKLRARQAEVSGAPWAPIVLAGGATAAAWAVGFNDLVIAIGVALQLLFIAFFVRHFAFAVAAMRFAPVDLTAPLVDSGFRPQVSVLVGCKNEERTVQTLVASLEALEYPHDRLQVILVDDGSSDRTGEILDTLAESRPWLTCLHRAAGAGGGKSGALNSALKLVRGEIVVVFDADHRPRRDVVMRLVRHFEDSTVAAVQGRCQIANPDDAPLSRLIAIDYMAGYLVNEYGRQLLFQLPAYGGANCAVRTSSLRAAGGWNVRSVTEDTDLTLRLVLRGERVRYDVTAVDEEEAVRGLRQFWRQRYRWARGHQQAWRDYRSAVLGSPLSIVQKIETVMFLLLFHIPVLAGVGLVVLGLWLAGLVEPVDPLNAFTLWTLLFLGPLVELGAGLLVARASRREALYLVLFMPLYLISIALCTKAWIDGVLGRPYSWQKTQRSGRNVPAEAPA